MESKDWILLIVPVIMNGILIFIMQSFFQMKIQRSNEKHSKKKKINEEFWALIRESKNKFRTFAYGLQDGDNESITTLLGEFNRSVRIFLDYYDDYEFFLRDYSSYVCNLRTCYDEYVEYGLSLKELDNDKRRRLEGYLNKIRENIDDLLKVYIKNI